MHDETLKKIALTAAIIGLVGLFMISFLSTEDELAINKVKLQDDGAMVSLSGEVTSIREGNGVTIMTLQNLEKINVFVGDALNVSVGDSVHVKGKVEEFDGKKEIMAEEVLR